MNNETFGMTFQYAICLHFKIENDISVSRIDKNLLKTFINSKEINKIFKNKPRPIEYLTSSKKFTSPFISRCPHNFLLENEETFSVRTFKGNGKMFAPKVVGQAGDRTFNHFFGDLFSENIDKENFKKFCLLNINKILPIVVDYALISDYSCWFYRKENKFRYEIIARDDLADQTYDYKDFTFTKPTEESWNESNTVKYKGKTVMELQLHKNRSGYKIRLHRVNFPELLKKEKIINNSTLGDTAELAICNIFQINPGNDNDRLVNNSDQEILKTFIKHYLKHKNQLFPYNPIKYGGTEKRKRGNNSKSGIDFYLEKNNTLSVKTNKSKSYKVCPPEIGQPSPKTFDLYFSEKGWYEGGIDENKFRELVRNRKTVSLLLKEYLRFLNECDYILWSICLNNKEITSHIINKSELKFITFRPELIDYSNDFKDKSSVTIKYGFNKKISIGEFQVHSARNSLKFRFNLGNLLSLKNDKN